MAIHRLSRIDHLRATAALMVLLWHFTHLYVPPSAVPAWGVLSIIEEGHTGVSLFCVISGFIFSYLYVDNWIGYAAFIRKRLLRIAPLFVFVLALTFYEGQWSNAALLPSILTTLHYGEMPGYFGPAWSVLMEFQFYFIFPFLLLFTRRFGSRYLIGLVILFIAIRLLVLVGKQTVQQLAYFSIFGHMDQFLCGMVAGLALKSTEPSAPGRTLDAIGFAGSVAAIALFYWWFNVQGGFYDFGGGKYPITGMIWVYLPTVEAVLYSLVLTFYVRMPALPGTGWLSIGLAYLGVISYSIYLDHMFVLPFVRHVIARAGIVPVTWEGAAFLGIVIAIPAVALVASATYFLIELPFLKLKDSRELAQEVVSANRAAPERTHVAD
jgi:peptidoglycan/LPS O-acetylase OafA/YrhL